MPNFRSLNKWIPHLAQVKIKHLTWTDKYFSSLELLSHKYIEVAGYLDEDLESKTNYLPLLPCFPSFYHSSRREKRTWKRLAFWRLGMVTGRPHPEECAGMRERDCVRGFGLPHPPGLIQKHCSVTSVFLLNQWWIAFHRISLLQPDW